MVAEERLHALAQVQAAREGDVQRVADGEREHAARAVSGMSEAIVAYLERIRDVVEAVGGTMPPEQVCHLVARAAAEASGATAATVVLEEGRHLRLVAGWNVPASVAEEYRQVPEALRLPVAEAMATSQGVFVEDPGVLLERYPDVASAAQALGTRAWASVPLVVGGRVLGGMSFSYAEPRGFAAHDREFLLTVGRVGAQAIDRARAHESLDRRARQQAAVAHLGLKALDTRELDRLLQAATEAVAGVLGCELCKVMELLPSGREVLLRAGVGWHPGLVGVAAVDTGLDSQAGYTLATDAPVVVEDLRTEARFRGPQLLRDHGVVSGMSCAIPGRGRPWGVLGVHTRERRAFDEHDVHFLQSVAGLLGGAVERHRAEDALQGANARLREAEQLRTRFLASVAHDLRTPITPMALQVDLLRQHLPPRERQPVDILERNLQRLSRLVDDLLDVARLQGGNLSLRRAPVDLGEVVAEAVQMFEPSARERRIRLEARVDRDLPVAADAQRLAQVLTNLLSNAVKFTPPGGTVAVEARREDGTAVVRVRDTGIGFGAGDLARLFQPFSQVHGGPVSGQGSGLGLYISKGLIEGHGGHIWGESPGPGKGATFTFTLPLGK